MLIYRKKIILFLLAGFLLQGCNDNDEGSDSLQGRWLSECIKPAGLIPGGTEAASHKLLLEFSEVDAVYSVNKYSDASCNNYVMNMTAQDAPNFFQADEIPESYTVGKIIKTNNGSEATELFITTKSGSNSDEIYQIKDGNKLYLGKVCADDSSEVIFNVPLCHEGMSYDIDYEMTYSRI